MDLPSSILSLNHQLIKFQETFSENEDGFAHYCASIVHGAASYMPDFLEYLGDQHGGMPIKHGIIGHQRDLETSTMSVYR